MGVAFALWFGAIEGFEAVVFRGYPSIQPFAKSSLDALWAAPLVHLAANLVAAILTALAIRVGLPVSRRIAIGVFGFVGAVAVAGYSGSLAQVSSVLLSLGVAAQLARVWGRSGPGPAWRGPTVVLAVALAVAPVGLRAGSAWNASRGKQAAAPENPSALNVLVLVLDTVRADHLSTYGYHETTTPAIDRIAAEGVLFERAFSSSSWTLPSHSSLLTGLPVSAHGTLTVVDRLAEDVPRLAQVFNGAGYATGAFVSNNLFVLPERGLAVGFDTFDVYDTRTLLARTTFGRVLKQQLRRVNVVLNPFRPAAVINGRFEDWVQTLDGRPFFALLNYMDAHEPYHPRDGHPDLRIWGRWAQRSAEENALLAKAYDGALTALDSEIGHMFDRLAAEPWWAHTLVVIVADHGERIEDGSFDHGTDLLPAETHVPLILWRPGRIPSGVRIPAPVTTTDLAATAQALTGVEEPRLPGRSLTRWFDASATSTPPDEPGGPMSEMVRATTSIQFRSIVEGDYQYILDVTTGAERLVDIAADPLGTVNLVDEPAMQERVQRMRAALERQVNP
jgi:arylsulfatase A-like enzyme